MDEPQSHPTPGLTSHHGLDVLLSFAYHTKTDLAEIRRAVGPRHLLVLDSGAFTAHSKGRPISLEAYETWLDRWRGVYDYAVTLDVIGNPAATDANTRRLHADGFPVVPVFTVGDDLSKLDRLAAEGNPLVYVGGLVGMRRNVMRPYLQVVTRHATRAGIAVHALGVGGVETLRATGGYSGDSSAPTQSPGFGTVCVWTGRGLTMLPVADKTKLAKHRTWLSGLGIPFRDLITGTVSGKAQRSIRDQVVCAGLWSFVAASGVIRTRYPMTKQGLPPGPRLLAAAATGDIHLVLSVAHQARTNPPPSVARIRVDPLDPHPTVMTGVAV